MQQRTIDALNILRRIELFRTFEEDQLRKVLDILRSQHFPAGTTIFLQEDPGDCLYIILEGFVRIYLLSMDGREVTFRVYGAGAAFGEFAVLDGQPRSACAAAKTDTSTLVIYRSDFRALMEKNPSVVLKIVDVLTERLRYTTLFSKSLAFLSASGRVAAALIALSEHTSATEHSIKLQITQRELATHAGVTREWTNHALRNFAEHGLIRIERGAIILLEREKLQYWTNI